VKLVHIASVVLFLGNIITGLYCHVHAPIAHAMHGVDDLSANSVSRGFLALIPTPFLTAQHAWSVG
jgi:hypothetical protein